MVNMSAAVAFAIGRRAETDIMHHLSEDEVKAEIRMACQRYIDSDQELDATTEEIYEAAVSQVKKSFCPSRGNHEPRK